MKHTLLATLDDEPGALERVIATCRKRAFNIHSLTVIPGAEGSHALLTLVLEADDAGLRRVKANLERLLIVGSVTECWEPIL